MVDESREDIFCPKLGLTAGTFETLGSSEEAPWFLHWQWPAAGVILPKRLVYYRNAWKQDHDKN